MRTIPQGMHATATAAIGLLFTALALGGENPALETTVVTWTVFQIASAAIPIGVGLTEWYAPS